MRDTFIRKLMQLALEDSRIMLVTGDLGFGCFDKFRECCPTQFINAGISEQNMTGLATGLALEGKIIFTYSIGNFSTLRCLEQIRNDACYHNANVKIVSIGGGFSYGQLGISHHATEDLAIMRSLPDITVLSPGGLWEVEQITEAITKIPGTCYLRLDKSNGDDRPDDDKEIFRLGKARMIRDGSDCSIITTGGILGEVLKAADLLKKKGIYAKIISMHTIQPIDKDIILRECLETGSIITVEEHTINGGLGGAVAETLLDNSVYPDAFLRIALEAGFSSIVGSQDYLRNQYGLDAVAISDRIQSLLFTKRKKKNETVI